MPMAALFIGGVLPAQLGSLIRKRAGYRKFNFWLKAQILISCKLQAPSLTTAEGYYRINVERNNMTQKVYGMTDVIHELKRMADAIEEILRLVKKDQEDSAARQRQWDAEKK